MSELNRSSIMKSFLLTALLAGVLALAIYYFFPYHPMAKGTVVDKIVVLKSKRQLLAYSHGALVKTYTVALGGNPVGAKQYEGDNKTPEGIYTINDKNPYSAYHKNLGVSYPNKQDIANAAKAGKSAGGEIKIHALRNDRGYIHKFQRWKDWTYGCMALTNEEIDDLYAHTPVGTVIEIRK